MWIGIGIGYLPGATLRAPYGANNARYLSSSLLETFLQYIDSSNNTRFFFQNVFKEDEDSFGEKESFQITIDDVRSPITVSLPAIPRIGDDQQTYTLAWLPPFSPSRSGKRSRCGSGMCPNLGPFIRGSRSHSSQS